jgi:hypothetical protein
MNTAAVLVVAFRRIRGQVDRAADGLDREALAYRRNRGRTRLRGWCGI